MAVINEVGVLVGVYPYTIDDKDTKEKKFGCKVVMARPYRPEEMGTGYKLYDLNHFGREGYDKYPRLSKEADGLSFEMVNVECELIMGGSKPKLLPLSIRSA